MNISDCSKTNGTSMSIEDKPEDHMGTVKMEGFDIEFGQLPTVASHLAAYDLSKLNDQELKELCTKARTYLRLLLDRAIARCER